MNHSLMIMAGAECPSCQNESFFPKRSIPNTTNILFRCADCGHEEEIEGKEEEG